jgi:hypothetical protein
MAVCLTVAPAAFAATFAAARPVHPGVFTAQHLVFLGAHHGIDWNVFTNPAASPLAFLEESGLPASEVMALRPVPPLPAGPTAEELERRALGWIAMLVGALLAAMQLIPKFHAYRVKLKSLDGHVPVH